jgi:hypothetical protein
MKCTTLNVSGGSFSVFLLSGYGIHIFWFVFLKNIVHTTSVQTKMVHFESKLKLISGISTNNIYILYYSYSVQRPSRMIQERIWKRLHLFSKKIWDIT